MYFFPGLQVIKANQSFTRAFFNQSPRFRKKNSGRYGSGLSCRRAIYLRLKLSDSNCFLFFKKKYGLIFYLADLHGRNLRIPGFHENKTHIEPYSLLKPTKVGFIFIGPNSLSRAKDLAAVKHVTQAPQAVVRVGSKIPWGLKVGFKELRLELKFLNRGLRIIQGLLCTFFSFFSIPITTNCKVNVHRSQ